jgi:hypothetical protein
MPRTAAYASRNSGRPPPWCGRDVEVVLPLELGSRIRREVTRLSHEGGFTIRRFGTVVVWSGGEPVGSFTLVRYRPDTASATIRRIEWDERRGFREDDVWQAVERLVGQPCRPPGS